MTTTSTPAQIAAADKARPEIAAELAIAAAAVRSDVQEGIYDYARLGITAEALLAAADRAEALVAESDPRLVLDLRDASRMTRVSLQPGFEYATFMPFIRTLAGAPLHDRNGAHRPMNKIAARFL